MKNEVFFSVIRSTGDWFSWFNPKTEAEVFKAANLTCRVEKGFEAEPLILAATVRAVTAWTYTEEGRAALEAGVVLPSNTWLITSARASC